MTIDKGQYQKVADGGALESWLREQIVPAYKALHADPSRAVSLDQMRTSLAAEYAKAKDTGN